MLRHPERFPFHVKLGRFWAVFREVSKELSLKRQSWLPLYNESNQNPEWNCLFLYIIVIDVSRRYLWDDKRMKNWVILQMAPLGMLAHEETLGQGCFCQSPVQCLCAAVTERTLNSLICQNHKVFKIKLHWLFLSSPFANSLRVFTVM